MSDTRPPVPAPSVINEQYDGTQVAFDPRQPCVAGGWKAMTSADTFKRFGKTRACRYCGQFIENGERYGLVVTNGRCSDVHPNFFIHEAEWDVIAEGAATFEEAVARLASRPQPRAKNGHREDPAHTAAVRLAIAELGYRITDETASLIYFKPVTSRRGEVAPFKYSKKHKTLTFTGRASVLLDRVVLNAVEKQFTERVAQIEAGRSQT